MKTVQTRELRRAWLFEMKNACKLLACRRLLLLFVTSARFERATRSLEGCCSIQLSYEAKMLVCFSECGCKGRHFPLKS